MLTDKKEFVKKKIDLRHYDRLRRTLNGLHINTVCTEARCPNISECSMNMETTFLIMGTVCTRRCLFCSVKKGTPDAVDPSEPFRVAEAVSRLELSHAVVTSPTRDDLEDGGAHHFARTVRRLKRLKIKPSIEVLLPDMGGNTENIGIVAAAGPDIIGHNMETVKTLYSIRAGADYSRSLGILKMVKQDYPHIKTKSAVMLGMGETVQDVMELLADLSAAGCDYLALGQYLAPTREHIPVDRYISCEEFENYRQRAYELGFTHAQCGTYVRSSYMAGRIFRGEF